MRWPRIRWPWRRKPPCRAAHDRAEEAARITRQQAEEAKQRLAESQRLAARFRELRQRNHFAESFRNALGEGR